MSKIEKRVVVKNSLERVFCYVPETASLPEIWPGLLEVGEVEHLPLGGAIARWLYKMPGAIALDLRDRIEPLCQRDSSLTMLGNMACEMKWSYYLHTDTPYLVLDGDHTLWSQN